MELVDGATEPKAKALLSPWLGPNDSGWPSSSPP